MFHMCIAHCIPEKIYKMSKSDNSCVFMWSTVPYLVIIGLAWCLYSIIDVWGYDREFCSSSPPPPSRITQKPNNIK